MLIILKYCVLALISLGCLAAQTGEWAEAVGKCNGANITPEEGWSRAINDARSNAIKEVVGVHITEEVYRNISEATDNKTSTIHDAFSKLSRSNSYGKIIEEEILDRKVNIENDIPVYTVEIRAKVVEDRGVSDPGFTVELVMPKSVFYAGGNRQSDELKFDIWASKDCYIYLFNIMADDSVFLLIPNQYVKNNYFSTEKDVQEYERELANLSFEVALPAGKDYVIEALYVIALKNKNDFVSNNIAGGAGGVIPTYQAAITDIQNWLIQIPKDQRSEAFKSFEIREAE